ncbi:short-chain dehydrogenase/reductase [Pedobacter ginsengisoli]|uniref:Short-chain dehydrogenase/reductase n=1 Tax=Pedobacter ginsengisoli TaxID=363852 RepID=A0A2D1U4X4_9SPHI|nr:oxidoreductase [Pedobacter ginsengisoli]ATP56635.1 short-chain dehydrogenase/reductase [Pedobacter ginsengisoli]
MEKVWLITGCSTGFGRELAKQVLELGYKAGVAARNIADVEDIVKQYPETSIAITLDVTKHNDITNATKQLTEIFGRVDVLVNNAGVGYFGSVEASDEHETRKMFDINFFGLANMTKAVLPHMRRQRSGHIINIASIGGLMAFPALAYYNATKFAVDGFSEALAKETAPLGIKVTIVAPSGFRTDWAGRSANEVQNEIEDYKTTAGANKDNIRAYSGNQPGDPVRAAKAIIKAVEAENPPLRLLLGAAALKNARKKIEELAHDFDAWEETTVGADFPKS